VSDLSACKKSTRPNHKRREGGGGMAPTSKDLGKERARAGVRLSKSGILLHREKGRSSSKEEGRATKLPAPRKKKKGCIIYMRQIPTHQGVLSQLCRKE